MFSHPLIYSARVRSLEDCKLPAVSKGVIIEITPFLRLSVMLHTVQSTPENHGVIFSLQGLRCVNSGRVWLSLA